MLVEVGELHPSSIARYARRVRALLLALAVGLALAQKAVPEHRLAGTPAPWVAEAKALVENPKKLAPHQTAELPEKGYLIYEYLDARLGNRTFETVLLAKGKSDAEDFVLELTPGRKGPPLAPEELGDVELQGEGPNFWIFRILEGPFKGHYLVWSTATGHRGVGGEAVRIYARKALAHEPNLQNLLR